MSRETVPEARRFAEMVASRQGWRLNPDTEFIEFLFEGLAKNSRRYGYYSCPCRDAHGERARDSDIICPCAYCRPDQEEYGHCYCGLFLTEKFAQGGGQPVSIPERRPGE